MGMSGKGGGSQMANPSLPLVGAPTSAPQFYTPGPFGSGMMFGGGSGYYGGAQSPYNPPGAGFYGGDALGTAGQLLNGGSAPSFNAAAGGNVQGIGYWPQNTPGAGGGKGGKGGGAGLPPPGGTPGVGAAPPPPGASVPSAPPPAGTPPAGAAPGAPPSWNATRLAQANGISPGLADFMLAHNAGGSASPADQQFYQAAGFMNPAGSQTMLNEAGRQWITNNDQAYGNINADAGQPNGPRMGYGMAGNTPYSYSLGQAATNPALQQWLMRARGGAANIGPPPTGATLYSQFGPGGTSGT